MVNKNADGALSREEVCSIMNGIVETADSLASAIGALFMVMVSRHNSRSMSGSGASCIPRARDSGSREGGGLSEGVFLASGRDTREGGGLA